MRTVWKSKIPQVSPTRMASICARRLCFFIKGLSFCSKRSFVWSDGASVFGNNGIDAISLSLKRRQGQAEPRKCKSFSHFLDFWLTSPVCILQKQGAGFRLWAKQEFFFTGSNSPSEENQGECSSDKPLGGPCGGPKVPPGPYAEKNFVFKSGVQTTQNPLICLDPLSWKTLWKKKTKIFQFYWFWCKNGECCRFRLFCRGQFWNETTRQFWAPTWPFLAPTWPFLALTWPFWGPNSAILGFNLAVMGPNCAILGPNLAILGPNLAIWDSSWPYWDPNWPFWHPTWP